MNISFSDNVTVVGSSFDNGGGKGTTKGYGITATNSEIVAKYSSFKKLEAGVLFNSTDPLSTYSLEVKGCEFSTNKDGVKVPGGSGFCKIINNTFRQGEFTQIGQDDENSPWMPDFFTWGVTVIGQHGFEISGNTFYDLSVGVAVTDADNMPGLIDHNVFDHYINEDDEEWVDPGDHSLYGIAVAYKNDNLILSNNCLLTTDQPIMVVSLSPENLSSIFPEQGMDMTPFNPLGTPAGNRFPQECINGWPDIVTALSKPFNYYHPKEYIGNQIYTPECLLPGGFSNFTNVKLQDLYDYKDEFALFCGVAITDPPMSINPDDNNYIDNAIIYTGNINNLQGQLDGGNTAGLLASVKDDAEATFTTLEETSPWLSEEVLTTMLKSNLPEDKKVEILLLNVPLTKSVFDSAKENLSSEKFDALITQGGMPDGKISPASKVSAQINIQKYFLDATIQAGLDYYIKEKDYKKALDLLKYADKLTAAKQSSTLYLKYLQDWDVFDTQIGDLINMGGELGEFAYLQKINAQMMKAQNWQDVILSKTDIKLLQNIAVGQSNNAGMAAALLTLLGKERPNRPFPRVIYSKTAKTETFVAPNKSNRLQLIPNPANHSLRIDMQDMSEEVERIQIYDALGALVWQQNLRGEKSIDLQTTDWQQGLYIIAISSQNNNKISYDKVLIVH